MGWDAFGLPAEQYAIETGTQPSVTTEKNCDNFRRQIKSLGLGYDWDREVNTTDPGYFRWTQWIFIQLYNTWFDEKQQKGRPIQELEIPACDPEQKARRAIEKLSVQITDWPTMMMHRYGGVHTAGLFVPMKRCLNDGTHEKCGNPVERKNLKQWMLRIPLYAERLLEGLENVDWPEGVKDMQRNWIGRSTGAEVDFQVKGVREVLRVFTTRPDTLFGATYMVVAPEHRMLNEMITRGTKR